MAGVISEIKSVMSCVIISQFYVTIFQTATQISCLTCHKCLFGRTYLRDHVCHVLCVYHCCMTLYGRIYLKDHVCRVMSPDHKTMLHILTLSDRTDPR